MWSGPRNISSALMRSFENRSDCFVSDEPFYSYFLSKTKLKNARSGVTFGFNEKDIKPEYPNQKTITKIIIDELIKLFFKIKLFFAEKTLCQLP